MVFILLNTRINQYIFVVVVFFCTKYKYCAMVNSYLAMKQHKLHFFTKLLKTLLTCSLQNRIVTIDIQGTFSFSVSFKD